MHTLRLALCTSRLYPRPPHGDDCGGRGTNVRGFYLLCSQLSGITRACNINHTYPFSIYNLNESRVYLSIILRVRGFVKGTKMWKGLKSLHQGLSEGSFYASRLKFKTPKLEHIPMYARTYARTHATARTYTDTFVLSVILSVYPRVCLPACLPASLPAACMPAWLTHSFTHSHQSIKQSLLTQWHSPGCLYKHARWKTSTFNNPCQPCCFFGFPPVIVPNCIINCLLIFNCQKNV